MNSLGNIGGTPSWAKPNGLRDSLAGGANVQQPKEKIVDATIGKTSDAIQAATKSSDAGNENLNQQQPKNEYERKKKKEKPIAEDGRGDMIDVVA